MPVPLTDDERERQDREGLTVEPLPPLYHCYVDPDAVLTVWRAYFDNRLRAQSRYVLEQQHLDVVAERDTLREALRIAVEALHEVAVDHEPMPVNDGRDWCSKCQNYMRGDSGCTAADATSALAAVRELVDLGGDDG